MESEKSPTPTLQRSQYKSISFDCYGTLIDWENGILGYLQPLFLSYDVHVLDEWVLESFARLEPEIQSRGGTYQSVLAEMLEKFGTRLAFSPNDEALTGFSGSIEYWQPFTDTVAAMASLKQHFNLVALSNVDESLISISAEQMAKPFTHIITAERVGVYKPDRRMFETLLREVETPILHVAQSRFHDIVPATELGLDTVWIDRPSLGAARPVDANPTWTFNSMEDFAAAWD
jgi:2-haloacid dehalogenase